MSKEFKNMKFRVSSPEQSEKLQTCLFSLGYDWLKKDKQIKYACSKFLYTTIFGGIEHGQFPIIFKESISKEFDTEQFILDNSPKPITAQTIETNVISLVNVLGKLYNKDDVENALSMLKQYKLEDV